MGTNYYLVKNRPSVSYPIHIGKSSAGWLFNFESQNQPWLDPPVVWDSYEQVLEALWNLTVDSNDFVIIDEYDEILTFADFIDIVQRKQNDPHCQSNKDNFTYSRNVNGYRFTDGEFR